MRWQLNRFVSHLENLFDINVSIRILLRILLTIATYTLTRTLKHPLTDVGPSHTETITLYVIQYQCNIVSLKIKIDSADITATTIVRQRDYDVRIVAAATNQGSIEKLCLAAANAMISPALIRGELLAVSARTQGDEPTELPACLYGDFSPTPSKT